MSGTTGSMRTDEEIIRELKHEIEYHKAINDRFWRALTENRDFLEECIIRGDCLRDDHTPKEELLKFLEWCDVRWRELHQKNTEMIESILKY